MMTYQALDDLSSRGMISLPSSKAFRGCLVGEKIWIWIL
jgi:hypothetical protein